MKILIAPDSFKGSISAIEAAKAISDGIGMALPHAGRTIVPMADGGDGTLDVLCASLESDEIPCEPHGPMGEKLKARMLLLKDHGAIWIEVAQACGLALIPNGSKNPHAASSYGVGEMIALAIEHDCREIILSLGGSGTNDGGIGMLKALGAVFYDGEGNAMPPYAVGLESVAKADLSPAVEKLAGKQLRVLCDVDNPLLGSNGATCVFGPQKGVKPEELDRLEAGMGNYADVVEKAAGKRCRDIPGAGAAGGLGFALSLVSDATFSRGAEFVIDLLGLEQHISGCDLVITGEGSFDRQTLGGKLPVSVALAAKRHGKPVIVLAGSVGDDISSVNEYGIAAVFGIQRKVVDVDEAMSKSYENLRATAESIAGVLALAGKVGAGCF